MCSKVLLLYGSTNRHLGLWKDLENDTRVIIRTTERRSSKFVVRVLRKIVFKLGCNSIKHLFYNYFDFFKIISGINHLVIIDGALRDISIGDLEKCRKKNKNLKIYLYLINSIDAQSPIMRGVKPKINKFRWDEIYSFDMDDATKYHYKYLGFCYYSFHDIISTSSQQTDAFFVGGLKGGRTDLINELYHFLSFNRIVCNFYLMPMRDDRIEQQSGIYYYRGWLPYDDILLQVQQSKCIIEIMQHGQSGATLRYFEAVCMNKKLLTNNPNIVNFPFYNPDWMKIFRTVDDVDVEWIKKDMDIDYGYNGEFSPIHFIDYITKDDEKI